MSKSASLFQTKPLRFCGMRLKPFHSLEVEGRVLNWDCYDFCVIGLTIFVIVMAFAAMWHLDHVQASGIVICSEHGVRSGATGNRQTTFDNGKRRDSCEYTHPLKDLSGSHKFWSECN